MYNKDNFKHMFSEKVTDTAYLIETIIWVKKQFQNKKICTLEELIGLGDSWHNRACIDKLCELGYIRCIQEAKVSNYNEYVNLRL